MATFSCFYYFYDYLVFPIKKALSVSMGIIVFYRILSIGSNNASFLYTHNKLLHRITISGLSYCLFWNLLAISFSKMSLDMVNFNLFISGDFSQRTTRKLSLKVKPSKFSMFLHLLIHLVLWTYFAIST